MYEPAVRVSEIALKRLCTSWDCVVDRRHIYNLLFYMKFVIRSDALIFMFDATVELICIFIAGSHI